MNIDYNTNLYCLIGNPINKSLSPKIHNYIFKEKNINSVYLCFNIDEKNLASTLNNFKVLGVKGFNVTIPHKVKIMKYLDDIDEEARYLESVNTVKNIKGRFIGYNTDGLGFIKSLKDRNIELRNKNVLVLGAGGASSAISTKLALEGVNKIIILNRTLDKAKKIATNIYEKFNDIKVEYNNLDKAYKYPYIDMLINCTSIGMYPNIDRIPVDISVFNKKIIVYDVVYKPNKTKLLDASEKRGFKIINGIDMLVNQGLLSQKIWFNYEGNESYNKLNGIKNFINRV